MIIGSGTGIPDCAEMTTRDHGNNNDKGSNMQRTKPPFRADHVGSLLRPAALKEAREKHAKGGIDAAALKAVEDREIERVIKKQEEVGIEAINDGKLRSPLRSLVIHGEHGRV